MKKIAGLLLCVVLLVVWSGWPEAEKSNRFTGEAGRDIGPPLEFDKVEVYSRPGASIVFVPSGATDEEVALLIEKEFGSRSGADTTGGEK